MRPSSIRVSTRFFFALFVLIASLVAVGGLGLRGLQDVQHANDQVFSDNLVTAEATSQLALDLANAERIGLELTASNHTVEIAELRAELGLIAMPQVNSDVARFLRLHAHDPLSERAELQRVPTGWRTAAQTERRALASVTKVGGALSEGRRARAADEIADTMDPLILYVSGREPIERDAAADAREGAQATYHSDQTWLIVVAIIAGAAAVVMLLVGVTLKRMVDQRAQDKRYRRDRACIGEPLRPTGRRSVSLSPQVGGHRYRFRRTATRTNIALSTDVSRKLAGSSSDINPLGSRTKWFALTAGGSIRTIVRDESFARSVRVVAYLLRIAPCFDPNAFGESEAFTDIRR
jgi:hypothetical protein